MAKRSEFSRRDLIAAVILAALVAAAGAALILRRSVFEAGRHTEEDARLQREAIDFDRFSTRRERSAEGERLSVSLRLRTSIGVSLPCYVFVVARAERPAPKLWAIWPAQPPGPAVTASGHFHGSAPSSGYAVTLSDTWTRVDATIPVPSAAAGAGFDTVVVYVVDPDGRILLSRPFHV